MALLTILFLIAIICIILLFQKVNELAKKLHELTEKTEALEVSLYVKQETAIPSHSSVRTEQKQFFSSSTPAAAPLIPEPPALSQTPIENYEVPTYSSVRTEQEQSSSSPKPSVPLQTPVRESKREPKKEVSQTPSRTREEWEMFIGGKLLNRIAALALIIGMGFFLQYAFEHNWINETMRVGIGALAGAGLLVAGARFYKKKMEVFAQGLIGAGTAIFYLTIFAAFNFYHLVSQPVAFVCMSCITALTFYQAMKYDALSISLLGWAGGFLTPFLLSTGQANETGLFTYILLLDTGLLLITLKKRSWAILELLIIGATYIIFISWYASFYHQDDYPLTALFLCLFWIMFFVVRLYQDMKISAPAAILPLVCTGMNAVLFYAFFYSITDPLYHHSMAVITLAFSGIYGATALAVRRRRPESMYLFRQHVLMTIFLLAGATAIEYSGFRLVSLWALEAIVLLWCAERWGIILIRWLSLSLLFLATLSLLLMEKSWEYFPAVASFHSLFNERALAFLVIAGVFYGNTILLRRLEGQEKLMVAFLHTVWMLLLFILCTVEIGDYFSQLTSHPASDTSYPALAFINNLRLSIFWSVYAMLLIWLGRRTTIIQGMYVGLGILALALLWCSIFGSYYVPIEEYIPVFNLRLAVFVLLLSILTTVMYQIPTPKFRWAKDVVHALQIISALLIFELITVETYDYFSRDISLLGRVATQSPDRMSMLVNLRQLALSGAWLLYSIILMTVGLMRRTRGARLMSIVLFGITILKVFIVDLSFLSTLYRIFSFIGLGLILFAVSYLYQRYKHIIFGELTRKQAEENVSATPENDPIAG